MSETATKPILSTSINPEHIMHKLRCRLCQDEHKNTDINFPLMVMDRGKFAGYACRKCCNRWNRIKAQKEARQHQEAARAREQAKQKAKAEQPNTWIGKVIALIRKVFRRKETT